MSYFTVEQDQALDKILKGIIEEGTDTEKIALIESYGLLDGLNKSNQIESVKEDVSFVAKEYGYSLANDEITDVAQNVMAKYNYADYHEYIQYMINATYPNRKTIANAE